MELFLVINKSSQFITQQKIFLNEENADNYINANQKDLAFKNKLLSKEKIKLKDNLKEGERYVYVLSDLYDSIYNKENIFYGIKNGKNIIGFYGDRQNAEKDGNKIEDYRNKKMSHIDWIEIEDLKPKKKPKIK